MVGSARSSSDREEDGPPRAGRLDTAGRYHDRAKYSAWNIGAYVVLLLVIYFLVHSSGADYWVPYVLAAVVLLLLIRYLSTHYVLDETYLRAARVLGGCRVALEDVREIDYASLRDLSPVGFFGSWGWRGRMWSPQVGTFDSAYTDTYGLLITTTGNPLFISPADPAEFARELSRRVRSFNGPLDRDVGDPAHQRVKPMPTF
jgi:hypothetical protein